MRWRVFLFASSLLAVLAEEVPSLPAELAPSEPPSLASREPVAPFASAVSRQEDASSFGGAGGERPPASKSNPGIVDCDVTSVCSGHASLCKQKASDPSKYHCTCEEGFGGHDCSRSSGGGGEYGGGGGGGGEYGSGEYSGGQSVPVEVDSEDGLMGLSPELLQKVIVLAGVCAMAMACVCFWVVCKSSGEAKRAAAGGGGGDGGAYAK